VCGPNADIHELIDYDAFCGVPGRGHEEEGSAGAGWDIDALRLAARLSEQEPPLLLDVREPHELEISWLPGAINIPLGVLRRACRSWIRAGNGSVLQGGTRSARALELLVSAGFKKVKNLKGGINAWAEEVDPKMPVYLKAVCTAG